MFNRNTEAETVNVTAHPEMITPEANPNYVIQRLYEDFQVKAADIHLKTGLALIALDNSEALSIRAKNMIDRTPESAGLAEAILYDYVYALTGRTDERGQK